MVKRQEHLSLVGFVGWGLACWLGTAEPAAGQTFDVTFEEPWCSEVNTPSLDISPCDTSIYHFFTGRSLYGPLTQIGAPIEISVQALPQAYPPGMPDGRLPLYFEVLPGSCGACDCHRPAILIWQTLGAPCDSTLWVASPPITLDTTTFPMGSEYWLQMTGFRELARFPQSSPAIRWLRVRSLSTAVASTTWGRVKSLFR